MTSKITFQNAILAVIASVTISGYYATTLLEEQSVRIMQLDARARALEKVIPAHINFETEAEKVLSPMEKETVKHILVYLQALCHEYDVPYRLAKGVITVESSWMPKAVSHKGALGLMQITPTVGHHYNATKEQLFNPYINIAIGVQYLAFLYEEFADWGKTLTAYSHGPTNTRQYSTEYQTNNMYTDKVFSWANMGK